MAVVATRRAVGGDQYGDSLKQVVRLERGLYGVMLARYTLPKLVQKYQSNEQEEKMFISVVVTHDRTNTQLPHFSEAFCGLRPTLFYDPVTNKSSNYVAAVYALTGGRIPREQIAPPDESTEPYEIDWDDLIGRPAMAFIEPSEKADKHGLFINRLKSLEVPDKGLQRAMKPIWEAHKVGRTESGLAYLTYPVTAYQDDAHADGHHNSSAAHDDDGDDAEIPF